jgi:hypothetical protein
VQVIYCFDHACENFASLWKIDGSTRSAHYTTLQPQLYFGAVAVLSAQLTRGADGSTMRLRTRLERLQSGLDGAQPMDQVTP